ncbi:hypothetical protein HG1_53100 [Bacillus anthracis]|uniref:Uncharacterized protein n=1 Tax=Bacillus anthracis TaxID=1392 RepID=A0A640M827_BACAN|nr:hypothetical protein HG1_53100 [Bacillus anthracis]
MYTHRDMPKPYKHVAPHFYTSYYVVCTITEIKKENAGKGHSLFLLLSLWLTAMMFSFAASV